MSPAHAAQGSLTIETDMLVAGCATGLRLFGSVEAEAGADGGVRLLLDAHEFFEPSDEFGISKALRRCEEVLRPVLPSGESTRSAECEVCLSNLLSRPYT